MPEPRLSRAKDPWSTFATWAKRRDARGQRMIVPVLGTGFNAQAGVTMSWGDLLETVQQQIGVKLALPTGDALIGNTTLAWEAMVSAGASASGRAPHRVEGAMLTSVAKLLRDHYRPDGATAAFARSFLDRGFSDVLSFNFDGVLHVERATWRHAGRSASGSPFQKTTSYAELAGRGTRLWYPHGFVRFPQAIQLGMRNYGTYMAELETARTRHKALEREIERRLLPQRASAPTATQPASAPSATPRASAPSAAERERVWAEQRRSARSWLDATCCVWTWVSV